MENSIYVINHFRMILFITIFAVITGNMVISPEASAADNIAIDGYDAVAYFAEGKADEGNTTNSFQWHGYKWLFASRGNRDLFTANPEKYAPQYDGFCAWAMSEGRLAKTDPKVWKIVNGKLYLNCSKAAFKKWEADIPGNVKKADENWKKKYLKK